MSLLEEKRLCVASKSVFFSLLLHTVLVHDTQSFKILMLPFPFSFLIFTDDHLALR